jgi:hypothetical protein
MNRILPFLLLACLLFVQSAVAAHKDDHAGEEKNCRTHDGKMDCNSGPVWCKSGDGSCSPEMRGRCGKRRGDWYGARQPVTTATEARLLLTNYFAGQEYTLSDVTEKKWGFKAEIFGKDGKIIDRVLIDKRSGRIRSLD